MDFVFGGGVILNGPGSSTGADPAAASSIGLSHENGPILYSEPNRTSAIDDIRSIVIYIFIITIFLSFFLILPGIRSEKFPTFLCITTSLIVTSIILISLFGTTWHVAEAPISAAYKAFSRDRIQGHLNVKIGLQSVNITLKAYKYYILHSTDGPIIMDNSPPIVGSSPASSMLMNMMSSVVSPASGSTSSTTTRPSFVAPMGPSESQQDSSKLSASVADPSGQARGSSSSQSGERADPSSLLAAGSASKKASSLAEELLGGRTSDGLTVDTELEVDEVFAARAASTRWTRFSGPAAMSAPSPGQGSSSMEQKPASQRMRKRSATVQRAEGGEPVLGPQLQAEPAKQDASARSKRQQDEQQQQQELRDQERAIKQQQQQNGSRPGTSPAGPKFTIKRVNVDINYNERFYWIEPNQMQQEYHNALERGLPYPILTVVEYLSQDEAGFNWSRQYRAAGYYSTILLWLSVCACILMFCLHCAAPKYGIYTMQAIGCLLLFTNLTYFTLVPRGERKLVIPFEGQSLAFQFGWNFWLVLIGGCLSLLVGTVIVIIDHLFPNYIFTTILDVDYDSQHKYYKTRKILKRGPKREMITDGHSKIHFRPASLPPFYADTSSSKASSSSQSIASSSSPKSTIRSRNLSLDANRDEMGGPGHENRSSKQEQSKQSNETPNGAGPLPVDRWNSGTSIGATGQDAKDAKLANTYDPRVMAQHDDGVRQVSTPIESPSNIQHARQPRPSGVFSQNNESEKPASAYSGGSSVVDMAVDNGGVNSGIDKPAHRQQADSSRSRRDQARNGVRETTIGRSNDAIDHHGVRL